MIQAPDLPLWAALIVGALILFGASVTLTGSLGLLRLRTFYDRVHAPTLGATLGAAGVLSGSALCFVVLGSRPVLHEALLAVLVTLTTPVTLMLLARAALYRDRTEGVEHVPADGKPPASPE